MRAELARRLAGRDRLDRAMSALIGNYRSHLGQFMSWSSDHEQPGSTRRLCADLLAPARSTPAGTPEQPEP